jgi:hypothetical protein
MHFGEWPKPYRGSDTEDAPWYRRCAATRRALLSSAEDNLNPERAEEGLCPAEPASDCAGFFGQPARFQTMELPATLLRRSSTEAQP